MAKKINLSNLETSFVEAVSAWNLAFTEIKKAAAIRKNAEIKADEEEKTIFEARKKAVEEGKSENEAISLYSLEPVFKARNAAKIAYLEAIKPYKEAQKNAYVCVSDSVYYAYLLTIEKMSMDAKGTLELKKGKSTEVHTVDKSFKAEIRAFLESVGVLGTDNETALNRAAEALRTLTAGGVKSDKRGEFLKAKGMSAFKDLFIRAFLTYGVKRNVLVVAENGTVTMRTFNNEKAEA